MNKSLYFVYIIETPLPVDLLEGKKEGELLKRALSLAGIENHYNLAVDEKTFDLALNDRLKDAIVRKQRIPILHFSGHGNDNGIVLTDGTFIEWEDLREKLFPIAEAFQGKLIICMSSCEGFGASMMAVSSNNELPFYALVGNHKKPTWDDAAVAFVTFYHRLFKGASIYQAIRAMHQASGDNEFMHISSKQAKELWTRAVERRRQLILKKLREMGDQK